jgi:hypothetical protein
VAERPVALITGASMGIGEVFADALVARGYDVALVARSAQALETIAERLRSRGARAEVIVADLADPASIERVAARAEAAFGHIDLLVNNAGFGAHGKFETLSAESAIGQIRLNVEALVALTHRLAPGMLARRSGGIINVASTAAFQPVPWMAVYGATKAFVLSFSEALAEEYRSRGVRVLALCPGATATNFFKTAGESAALGTKRSSADVVATALRAYDRGQTYVVDGFVNRILAFSPRLSPRPIVARLAGLMMRGGT